MNHVHLIGRLGADPLSTPYASDLGRDDPKIRVRFDLAVDGASSRKAEETPPVWVPIVLFDGQSARFAAEHLTKGDLVALSGRLDLRRWTDEDGKPIRRLQVIASELRKLTPRRTPDDEGADPPPEDDIRVTNVVPLSHERTQRRERLQ